MLDVKETKVKAVGSERGAAEFKVGREGRERGKRDPVPSS